MAGGGRWHIGLNATQHDRAAVRNRNLCGWRSSTGRPAWWPAEGVPTVPPALGMTCVVGGGGSAGVGCLRASGEVANHWRRLGRTIGRLLQPLTFEPFLVALGGIVEVFSLACLLPRSG